MSEKMKKWRMDKCKRGEKYTLIVLTDKEEQASKKYWEDKYRKEKESRNA